MRGLIALQSTACEINESISSVSRSFGVRTRPRVAFHAVISSFVTKRESFPVIFTLQDLTPRFVIRSALTNTSRCSHGAVSPCSCGQQHRNASTQRGDYNIRETRESFRQFPRSTPSATELQLRQPPLQPMKRESHFGNVRVTERIGRIACGWLNYCVLSRLRNNCDQINR